MKLIGFTLLIALVLTGLVFAAGQLGLLQGQMPSDLGVRDGRLKPPSLTPNSVSSQALLSPEHPQSAYAYIEPFVVKESAEAAMEKIARILQSRAGTVIVGKTPDYLYAQCSTALLKFTDDLEFWLDRPQGIIHVRSASRLGLKDFGVNRARVEAIRAEYSRP